MFLDPINIKSSSIEENCNSFYNPLSRNSENMGLENELLKFFTIENQRDERGEISTETIKNYLKLSSYFVK
jgi:hypothetical protein